MDDINNIFELLTEAPGQVKPHSVKHPATVPSSNTSKPTVAGPSQASTEAQRLGLVHLGYGYYGKAKGQPPSHKSEDGKLRKLSGAEISAHAKGLDKATGQGPKPLTPQAPGQVQGPASMDGRGGLPQPTTPSPSALGPEDYADAPDLIAQHGKKVKPVVPGKPTRDRRMGKTTPGGDSKVKDQIVQKGMLKSTGLAAPGNPGSALNEILTGEALHRLFENPSLASDEIGLALQLYKEYKGTGLGKENTKGDVFKITRDPRLKGINKELYAKMLATGRAGMGEARRITMALKTVGWTLKDSEIHHFYGAQYSKLQMIEMLEKAIEKKKRILGPAGDEISAEDASLFVKKSGSRDNPSDTAVFVRNKSGDLMLSFTSNKLTPGDIQANSSPTQEISDINKFLGHVGLDSASQLHAAKIIEDTSKQIKEIQSNISNTIAPTANYFMHGKGSSHLKDLIKLMTTATKGGLRSDPNRTKRYQQYVQNKFAADKMNKTLAGGGTLAKDASQLQQLMKRANPEWKGGTPTDGQKMRAFLQNLVDGKGTADELKLLSRTAVLIPGVPSSQAAIADIRSKVIDSEFTLAKKLNRFKTKDGIALGTYVEAIKLQHKLHLSPAFDGDKEGIYKHDGLFQLNMGGVMVGPKQLQHCMGVTEHASYLNSFHIGKPEYSKDKEGNITGSKVMVYRLDNQGHQVPIATKTIRSTQGTTGKLASTYYWHPNIQKCFESNQ